MAPTLITNAVMPQYIQAQMPPPSPPADEGSRCSLPSISNLLGLADQGSPTSELSPVSQTFSQSSKSEARPESSHYANPAIGRAALPPSPPLSSESSFGSNSPSTRSMSQASNASNYYFETTPPLMDSDVRQFAALPRATFNPSAYNPNLTATWMAPPPVTTSYYAPMPPQPPPQPQVSALFMQRPLPTTFLPMPGHMGMPGASYAGIHHHYIPPSTTSFSQSQDRYICQTCNKAFSRPSSLRIHSHSHTGEKPFKCPHAGCGKAFSVRSNMRRHERGCHNTPMNG